MNRYTRWMSLLIVLAAILAAGGVLVAGGDYVEAAGGAASTLLLLGVGVPTAKWLWKDPEKLGKKLIGLAAVILALTAAVSGWLSGGSEKLATVMATPTPTPTPQQTPMEQRIKASASAREVADLWIGLNYSKDRSLREVLPGSEMLVAQDGSIDPGELWVITATLGITPTGVVTEPMATLRYIGSQSYSVQFDGETRHVMSIVISPEIRVELYELPPMEITNGDVKEITQVRHAYVIVHLIPPPPVGEIGRNNWLVAGMLLTQ
jgi:hypothetical protein